MILYKQWVQVGLAGLLVATAGCAANPLLKAMVHKPIPGYGINEKLATISGCDLQDIKIRAKEYQRTSWDEGGPGYVVPSIGDSLCDVFAKLGAPDRSTTIATAVGGAVNLWYHTGSTQTYDFQTHVIVLEENETETAMIVTSVVW